ncbi:DUF402 domain-containing protein [Lederbergia sp. NSJ-179]|uniref:DUF402 domain-containing protein n=1 Tax=Lederbergia sp. NSJ-179 TaxID=2931402 RepID=UPI001FD3C164|nr:DUF402 domain-containing protein [Lederbergia sp. NSJ-179]MCJ7841303.1 DUF402 domain-containing protein [Lederbergia sp. NSJ-179]
MRKERFEHGDQVVLRRIFNDEICRVTAATVVKDDPDLISLYWGPGYPLKVTKNPLIAESQEPLCDTTWGDMHLLMLATPGDAYGIYAMHNKEDYKLECWYINLQEPLRRTAIGFDTMDYLLDINVSPDRSEWSWKDEEDFNKAVQSNKISKEQAQAIRLEGERAIKKMQTGSESFFDMWEKWTPPTEWEIPALPLNWDEIYE